MSNIGVPEDVIEMKASAPDLQSGAERATPYAYYALLLLTLANFFNYVDRYIVSIVAQRLKADLHLTDAQLGFLLGTAFAVFYGVVGIAMGRIADALRRTRVMAFGLGLWSAMTALSGLAPNFGALASGRLFVGIGEAAANPCSQSLLSDYFPQRRRATAIAVYLLGTYLGGAASMIGGGLLLQNWGTMCHALPGACGLAPWRAAFLILGAPGVLLAVGVATLREPARPQSPPLVRSVWKLVVGEMSAAVPPFTLLNLHQVGGSRSVTRNLAFAAILALCAVGLTLAFGDAVQWAAVALGVYSVTTWANVLRHRDRPLHVLTFGSPTFVLVTAGAALTTCILGAVQAWGAPYAMRVLGATPVQAGLSLGLSWAVAASLSVLIGGAIGDVWKRHDPRAPMWITLIALVTPAPALVMMLRAHTLTGFVEAYAAFMFLSMSWAGPVAALIQEIVLPRMRGTSAAAFSLTTIVVAASIGPYWTGKISTLTGSLATGLYCMLIFVPLGAIPLFLAARRLGAETSQTRLARARAAGEAI